MVVSAHVDGCSVDYSVTKPWPGYINVDVGVTNLGDTIDGWTVTWSFDAGQQLTGQSWGAVIIQEGNLVYAKNLHYNMRLETNASISFNFEASSDEQSSTKFNFSLNDVPCNGIVLST
jgi:hypothetical protein